MGERDDLLKVCRHLTPAKIERFDRATKEQLLQFLAEEETRRASFPLAYYRPLERLKPAHESDKRVRVVLGANQSGKTHFGAAEVLAHVLGYYPWRVPDFHLIEVDGRLIPPPRDAILPEYWVRRSDGTPIAVPNKGMIITGLAVQKGIGECIWPKIEELWGGVVPIEKWMGQTATPIKARFPNGSTLLFASSESAGLSFEALTYHFAWIDEPVPSSVYSGVWRGLLRNYGRLWLTQTPLTAKARWVYLDLLAGDPLHPREDVFVVMISQRENPYLDETAIKAFEDFGGFSDSERSARLFGRPEFLSDSIWSNFDRNIHIIEPFDPPAEWPRGLTVDPHVRRPWLMGWWCVSPTGQVIFYREHPTSDFHRMRSSDATIADVVEIIRRLEGKERITYRVMDPNLGKSPTVRPVGHAVLRTFQEEMTEYGLDFSCRVNDSLDFGIEAVRRALQYDVRRPMGADNQPKLLFTENCRNLILAMENFCYLPIKKDTRLGQEQVSEEYKDGADVVRYSIVFQRPSLTEPYQYLTTHEMSQWDED